MTHHHDVIILLLNKGVEKTETESHLIWNLYLLKNVVSSFMKSKSAGLCLNEMTSDVSEVSKLSIRCKKETESV